MTEKKLCLRWLPQAIALMMAVMPHLNSARIDNVVVVMPKGPRTLQMLGSLSPQLLHTISDVLKPVPPNVVQVPVPYYPDHGDASASQHEHYSPNALNSAYFTSPFAHHVTPSTISTATSYTPYVHSTSTSSVPYPFSFDPHSIQPGPYDTPFIPKLKPSPVNPLHIENPPDIRFTPINLLPPAPPSFDTIRNYVQKLKAKQKEFFDTQGFEYGLFTQPNTKPSSYHRPVEQKKKYKHKYKHNYEALFSNHPNELTYIGHANLEPHEEDNVYYTEPDAGNKYYYTNTEGHEFVLPPENEFKAIPLGGIIDPEDAHFVEHGEDLLLKTKHPDAAVVTANQLDAFIKYENQLGLHPKYPPEKRHEHRRPVRPLHHRNKRFKKNDRVGRASGDQNVEADFYDSDEEKKTGELDFEDVEEEIRMHENFEPKKTYTQVRHLETVVKKSEPESEPKIKEKVTISKTNIYYSEKGNEEKHYDHGAEESFGEFKSKSKTPKKHRGKRDVAASFEDRDSNIDDDVSADSEEDNGSRENEIDYEYYPEHEYNEDNNGNDTIYLPYAQALVFQNDTDMFVLPIPEALVDPRKLHGEDLLNFLDEAIKNSTEFLPPEKEKTVKISPEIQNLQGQELIEFLDEAIKTSNQYLLNGPEDAIELVNPPRLGSSTDLKDQSLAEPLKADHVIEYEMEPPRPEDVHSEVLKYTQQHTLPDAPEYEVVNFVQPFKTLLRLQKANPDDYEIEFDAQDPRQLHGEDLLRFLDEAIGNTTLYIPEEHDDPHEPTPYLKRAFHYVDVDTALGLADNISTEVTDYLKDRIPPQPVELAFSEGNDFVPVRRTSDNAGQQEIPNRGKNKQSNPEVAVYNDVIRHIKNHMSASKSSKSKNGNVFMIAVPRSMRGNKTRSVERRQDGAFDSLRLATVYPLPIFDINQFYPTIFSGNSGSSLDLEDTKKDEFQQALEHEAERLVEKQSNKPPSKDQASHEQRLSTKSYFRDGIPDAYRDRTRYRGPRPGPQFPQNSYAVKEKIRDYPQPTFKKPGPPYEAIPLPPSNPKTKLSSLNAASNQRAVRHPPPPQFPPLKKRKRTHRRPYKKLKRVPSGVRTKVRFIKR
ncbi:uncharacterized protein LOC110675503 [Aedes aegypti]|uniref:Uncharacterized protein n=1 Tax=Aedes aegypti TaxID=7159 RepID=A0A6I8TLM5_AEDAE|nr:uncharacterized protein LOC110675503 [Aedes aegypti]